MTTIVLCVIAVLLWAIWGALLKLTDHIKTLREIAETRAVRDYHRNV